MSRYKELYQLEVDDGINSYLLLGKWWSSCFVKGWLLTVKCSCSHLEHWMFVRSRAYSWSVGSHQFCGWDLNIFTPQTCLIPMSSFYYPEIHGSPKAQFPKCVKGNYTFQREFSGQISLRHNIGDAPLLEIHNVVCFGLDCVPPWEKICWSLNPQCLRIWLYKVFTEIIKLKEIIRVGPHPIW